MEQQQEQIKNKADWESVKLALGTLSAEEVVNFLAHGGNLAASGGIEAAIFGGAIAALAGWNAPPIVRWLRASLPQSEELEPFQLLTRREPGKRSIVDKLLDRHPESGEQAMVPDEVETEPLRQPSALSQYLDDDDEFPMPTPVGASSLFTFSQVLETFTPSFEQIFLGVLADGTHVYVPAEDLCHVALAGNTGGGKSSLLRMIMAQLCYAGAHVLLLNPHYTRFDRKHNEDWTPYDPYLEKPALECSRYENIKIYLQWMAETLLPRRIERVREGRLPGRPYFVILDELPDVITEIKEASEYIAKILRQGRKYGIYLIVASQDFLAKTVSGDEGGAIRKMYRTALYVGGDATTAKTLLNMHPKDIPETQLGKGTIMLRCSTTKQAVMTRVPYLDNAALYRLLGPSTFVLPEEEVEDDLPVYTEKNDKQPTKQGVYVPVNEPVAVSGGTSEGAFINAGENAASHAQMTERAPVNEEIRKHIRRMNEMGYPHRDISKIVGLYGAKYTTYKQVCAEEGICID